MLAKKSTLVKYLGLGDEERENVNPKFQARKQQDKLLVYLLLFEFEFYTHNLLFPNLNSGCSQVFWRLFGVFMVNFRFWAQNLVPRPHSNYLELFLSIEWSNQIKWRLFRQITKNERRDPFLRATLKTRPRRGPLLYASVSRIMTYLFLFSLVIWNWISSNGPNYSEIHQITYTWNWKPKNTL